MISVSDILGAIIILNLNNKIKNLNLISSQ